MSNVDDKSLSSILMNSAGHPFRDPSELEEVLEAAFDLIDSPDFHQAFETYGELVLACVYAELADKLVRYGLAEEKLTAIARSGRDRKFERANELFKILNNPD
jgi:hypothetical protein